MKTNDNKLTLASKAGFQMLLSGVMTIMLFASVPAVRAQTVLSNMSESTDSIVSIDYYNWYGTLFRTDSSADSFELASVTLSLGGGSELGGNFFVSIYSNRVVGGTTDYVDAELEQLSGSLSPTAAGDYTFTSNGLVLQADTLYWLVTGVSTMPDEPNLGYTWGRTSSANYTGEWERNLPVGGGFADPINVAYYNRLDWSFSNSGYFKYSIDAAAATSAVPEPSTYAAILGVVALGFVAWRRRRAAA